MIDSYIPGFNEAMHVIAGRQMSDYQTWLALACGGILLLFIFHKSVNAMGERGVGFIGTVLGSVVGLFVLIAGAGLSVVYLKGAMGTTALVYFGAILISFVIVVPLLSAILKNGYFCILTSWGLAVVSLVVMCIGISGIFDLVGSSDEISDSQKRRNAGLGELIDR